MFVIGGAQVYEEAIKHDGCQAIYLTQVRPAVLLVQGLMFCPLGVSKDSPPIQITSPEFEVDTFFPQIDPHSFKLDASYPEQGKAHEERGVTYEVIITAFRSLFSSKGGLKAKGLDTSFVQFKRYVRSKSVGPHEEEQYLRLVHEIIQHGNDRDDRTGVGAYLPHHTYSPAH